METRPTHEVMRESIDKIGVKKVSGALGVSSSLIYKWCQPPKGDSADSSGAANPLDRLLKIYELSQELDLVHFMCRKAGGYYTPNPHAKNKAELKFVTETIEILNKFADMMHYAERSLSNDGVIDKDESIRLRRDWDRLKSRLEHFISACEAGQFNIVDDETKNSATPEKA